MDLKAVGDPIIKPIGFIHTNYPDKFGIPRQSGIVDDAGYIELLKPYNDANALRGLEEFSHLWLIWLASENLNSDGSWDFHATARPPRLGGNTRKGIFATRSPFHPNRIGLSCVKLLAIEKNRIAISGADVVDGTPLLDIKPYIPYSDSHPDALCSYAQSPEVGLLEVVWPEALEVSKKAEGSGAAEACEAFEGSGAHEACEAFEGSGGLNDSGAPEGSDGLNVSEGSVASAPISSQAISPEDIQTITRLIAQNPRPQYQTDEDRIYAMRYSCYEVKFSLKDGVAVVHSVARI